MLKAIIRGIITGISAYVLILISQLIVGSTMIQQYNPIIEDNLSRINDMAITSSRVIYLGILILIFSIWLGIKLISACISSQNKA